jgi:hypothetical protein
MLRCRLVVADNGDASSRGAHYTPTTYGSAAVLYPLACKTDNHYGLSALAGALPASRLPEATQRIALAHVLPRRYCKWAALSARPEHTGPKAALIPPLAG